MSVFALVCFFDFREGTTEMASFAHIFSPAVVYDALKLESSIHIRALQIIPWFPLATSYPLMFPIYCTYPMCTTVLQFILPHAHLSPSSIFWPWYFKAFYILFLQHHSLHFLRGPSNSNTYIFFVALYSSFLYVQTISATCFLLILCLLTHRSLTLPFLMLLTQ